MFALGQDLSYKVLGAHFETFCAESFYPLPPWSLCEEEGPFHPAVPGAGVPGQRQSAWEKEQKRSRGRKRNVGR